MACENPQRMSLLGKPCNLESLRCIPPVSHVFRAPMLVLHADTVTLRLCSLHLLRWFNLNLEWLRSCALPTDACLALETNKMYQMLLSLRMVRNPHVHPA